MPKVKSLAAIFRSMARAAPGLKPVFDKIYSWRNPYKLPRLTHEEFIGLVYASPWIRSLQPQDQYNLKRSLLHVTPEKGEFVAPESIEFKVDLAIKTSFEKAPYKNYSYNPKMARQIVKLMARLYHEAPYKDIEDAYEEFMDLQDPKLKQNASFLPPQDGFLPSEEWKPGPQEPD